MSMQKYLDFCMKELVAMREDLEEVQEIRRVIEAGVDILEILSGISTEEQEMILVSSNIYPYYSVEINGKNIYFHSDEIDSDKISPSESFSELLLFSDETHIEVFELLYIG